MLCFVPFSVLWLLNLDIGQLPPNRLQLFLMIHSHYWIHSCSHIVFSIWPYIILSVSQYTGLPLIYRKLLCFSSLPTIHLSFHPPEYLLFILSPWYAFNRVAFMYELFYSLFSAIYVCLKQQQQLFYSLFSAIYVCLKQHYLYKNCKIQIKELLFCLSNKNI